jgi:CBS-domain-containing membrane protein
VVIDSAEAEKLMREGNLRQLPVLTREKRMVGIVTLEDIIREQRAVVAPASSSGYQSIRNLEATKLTDPAHRSPGPNSFEQTC